MSKKAISARARANWKKASAAVRPSAPPKPPGLILG